MSRKTKPFHRRWQGDALQGYRRLSLELRGAYTTLLDVMYDHGGPVEERFVCAWLGCDVRVWKRIRRELVDVHHKILAFEDTSGVAWLVNERAQKELGLPTYAELVANLGRKFPIAIEQLSPKSEENSKENNTDDSGDGSKTATSLDSRIQSLSVPNGTGADRPAEPLAQKQPKPPPDPNFEAWGRAVSVVQRLGRCSEKAARSFFGLLLKETSLEARDLLPSILACELKGTQDPQGYLRQAAKAVAERRGVVVDESPAAKVSRWGPDEWRAAVSIFAESGRWSDAAGPPPDASDCRAPPDILAEFKPTVGADLLSFPRGAA